MIGDFVAKAALYAVPLLFGVVIHEVAHGWMAEKRGDLTARLMGRITLNPMVHIDLIGTIILPLILLVTGSPILFGWAKPVPVNFSNLRGGRRDMALVALSGPVTNFLVACLSALVYHSLLFAFQSGWVMEQGRLAMVAQPLLLMARISVTFNLVLMVINLFPIPPLDGGRVAAGLLPERLGMRLEGLENVGMLIVLILIMVGAWGYIINPILGTLLRMFLG